MAFTSAFLVVVAAATIATAVPTATDTKQNITYHGFAENAVDKFLNIPYGQDTSGSRRFAPPIPYVFPPNVTYYDASVTGPVCPQPEAPGFAYSSNATDQSEDCLRLKLARPAGTEAGAALPVMVYIYGGECCMLLIHREVVDRVFGVKVGCSVGRSTRGRMSRMPWWRSRLRMDCRSCMSR